MIKKNKNFIYSVFIIIILMYLGSCDLLSVSMEQRINLFENDLNNGNYDNLYENFHTDVANRQNIADEEVFDTGPLSWAYEPFVIRITNVIDNGDGTGIVAATLENDNNRNTPPYYSFDFTMKADGNVWYIRSFDLLVGVIHYIVN